MDRRHDAGSWGGVERRKRGPEMSQQAADEGSCFEETLMTKAFPSNMELIRVMSEPGRRQRVVTTPP